MPETTATRPTRPWPMIVLLGALGTLAWAGVVRAQAPCPNPPPVVTTVPQPPTDVCIPPGFSDVPFQFFDDFSWRSFVAMVWPALDGQRGMPDTGKSVGASGPRVFETYKALAEVFHNDGSAPSGWNEFDPPALNACGVQMKFGDLVLASFSKFSDLGQAGFGSLVGPLVAQNKTYVRFLTGFNQVEFTAITQGQWYLRNKIPAAGVTFPNASIDLKSSWVLMANVKNPQRFYTRTAWVLDPQTGSCSQTTVGLVGLHIVQKTPTRPQWIWTTFEHVDNVPGPGAQSPFTFNNGQGTPMPSMNPFPINPLPLPTPAPFNVSRVVPISPSTQATNAAYQKALAGTPWQFYQLVMTQWPVCLPTCDPSMRGTPANTFPGTGATTAFANTTMETFDQGSIFTGCMSCHNATQTVSGVQQGTDFLWSLRDHAFPPNVPNLLFAEPFRQLQSLLSRSGIPAKQAGAAAKRDKAMMNKTGRK